MRRRVPAVLRGARFLSQGVLLGLAPDADEQYFADTARALVSGANLVGGGAEGAGGL
nr:hypothetical protein [Streptomyces sp. ZEA17I]